MVVKVYISGISGNKEVKKRQQRVLMILDSKSIKYEVIDITEPGREADKDFMQNNSKSNGATVSDPNPRSPLPPQVFNDEEYCGDYDQFDLANEVDTLEVFLKMEAPAENSVIQDTILNGVKNDSKKNSREATPAGDIPGAKSKSATPKSGTPSLKEATPERKSSVGKEEKIVKQSTLVENSAEIVTSEDNKINDESLENKSEIQESITEKELDPSEDLIANEQAASTN